ncbi:MAG: DUF1559 domain-containing protein [Pirellulales bacterium]|nr:DUF1559 domain-containing protein [Pirellulales bacterium]
MGAERRPMHSLCDVVISLCLIGFLLLLLLPAANQARSGSSANCLANLTNLGKALISHDAHHAGFPGYKNVQARRTWPMEIVKVDRSDELEYRLTNHGGRLPSDFPQSTGWIFPLLPYLDRADIASQFGQPERDEPGSLQACTPILRFNVCICPNDPFKRDEAPAALSYVVNCGMVDLHTPGDPSAVCGDAEGSPDLPANGVFHYRYPFTDNDNAASTHTNVAVREVAVSASDLVNGDGTTNTLLLSENADAGLWTDDHEWQVGFVWEPAVMDGHGVWADSPGAVMQSQARSSVLRINEGMSPSSVRARASDTPYRFARPSSHHKGGVNVFFAGGNGRLLSETIDPVIYAQLMSVKGAATAWPLPAGRKRIRLAETAGWQNDFSVFARPLPESAEF